MATLEQVSAAAPGPVSLFKALKTHSRAEVRLLNWSLRAFSNYTNWKSWFQEGFAALLEVQHGTLIHLEQNNEFESKETKVYRSDRLEVRIGRDPACDVVLELRVVSKNHARIFQKGSAYYLEDTGSAAGTYLNKRKLAARSPELLSDGDEFDIVPYTFTVSTEQVWSAEDQFDFWSAPAGVTSWCEFDSTSERGAARLQVAFHPGIGSGVLEADRTFLRTIVQRLTRTSNSRLVDSDLGIFEFLITSVLAKASQDLQFPFQFSLQRFENRLREQDLGLVLQFSLGLSGVRSMFRLFIPSQILDQFPRTQLNRACPEIANPIRWLINVSTGCADFSFSQFQELEEGDVVLFTSEITLLLPRRASKPQTETGWAAKYTGDDPHRIEIIEFFERKLFMSDVSANNPVESGSKPDDAPARKPDFSDLPIRLHVILSQTELTLADLNGLVAGTIVELERNNTDPVHLAANGSVIGSGELVEVDGKLGVRILQWSGS